MDEKWADKGIPSLISSRLEIHDDATGDLRAILLADPEEGRRIAALLAQMRLDPQLHERLLTRDVAGGPPARPYSAKRWGSVARIEKLHVWRLRAWPLEQHGLQYRLFYVYDFKRRVFAVIGISPRGSFDYDDPQHPLRVRMVRCIRRDYGDT